MEIMYLPNTFKMAILHSMPQVNATPIKALFTYFNEY